MNSLLGAFASQPGSPSVAAHPVGSELSALREGRRYGFFPGLQERREGRGKGLHVPMGGFGEWSQFVGDGHLAVAIGVVQGYCDRSCIDLRGYPRVPDATTRHAVDDHPCCGRSVGLGLKDGSRCGVIGNSCSEVWLPLRYPLLFTALRLRRLWSDNLGRRRAEHR